MNDTILCLDKEDAKNCIDDTGGQYIEDWEFLEDGKVRLILNCKVSEIKEIRNKSKDTEIIEKVKEDMCDNYCKYPDQYDPRDWDNVCEVICKNCPLNRLET